MTLKEKRIKFTGMVAALIIAMSEKGFQPALAYVKRCPDCKVGHPQSTHKSALAVDIDLYDMFGNYLDTGTEHLQFGLLWETWGGSWGGRFTKSDPNHYAIQHEGVR